jgi:drug/metabolite transporter (DMT)-like permease
VGASLLGFSAIYVKWTSAGGVGPFGVGFYRMFFALPWVAAMAWPHRREGSSVARKWALVAGLCFAGDLWLWHGSMHYTSAANATLLVGLAPLWVALISVGFFHARLRKRAWLGLVLAVAGACVLGFARGARLGSGFGELLGALASLCYAAFVLALGRARKELSAPAALFFVMVACLLGCGFGMLLTGEAFHGFSWKTWYYLAVLAVVVQVIAWWLITWGLGHVDTNLGSVGLLLQSVATVALGSLYLHERIQPMQGLGTLLLLLGIGLCASAPPLPVKAA